MAKLSHDEIGVLLGEHAAWRLESGELVRGLEFDDFLAAMRFVNRVAVLAEEAGHHPDIDVRYNKVRLALVSHDVGGMTDRDARLVGRIDGIDLAS